MANTIEEVIAYARTHPKRDGGTWHNWCESFVWRAGGFSRSFATARLAGDASGPLSTGPAPRGAIHQWGGTVDGHTGFELGNNTILMASDGITDSWGTALGTTTLADYNRRKPSMKYRGWSMRHGTETLAPSASTSGSIGTEIDMAITNEDVVTFLNGGFILGKNADGSDRWTTIMAQLKATNFYGDYTAERLVEVAAQLTELSKAVKDIKVTAGGTAAVIDYAALAKAVNDDAARRLAN